RKGEKTRRVPGKLATEHRNRNGINRGILESLMCEAAVNLAIKEADAIGPYPCNYSVSLGIQPGGYVSLLIHGRLDESINNRRYMVADSPIDRGNSAILEMLINRVPEIVTYVLVRRGREAAANGREERSEVLLERTGRVPLGIP